MPGKMLHEVQNKTPFPEDTFYYAFWDDHGPQEHSQGLQTQGPWCMTQVCLFLGCRETFAPTSQAPSPTSLPLSICAKKTLVWGQHRGFTVFLRVPALCARKESGPVLCRHSPIAKYQHQLCDAWYCSLTPAIQTWFLWPWKTPSATLSVEAENLFNWTSKGAERQDHEHLKDQSIQSRVLQVGGEATLGFFLRESKDLLLCLFTYNAYNSPGCPSATGFSHCNAYSCLLQQYNDKTLSFLKKKGFF